MTFTPARRLLSVALVATLFALPSVAQSKRRAVTHPGPAAQTTADISGTVVDAKTNAPVVGATVKVGRISRTTDTAGKFTVKGASGSGSTIALEISRTGYDAKTVNVAGGQQSVTVQLDPHPTVSARDTDGNVYVLDDDSIEFGYSVPFSGYRAARYEDFCKPDGTAIVVDRSQISRISGPATTATSSACCPGGTTQKITVTTKGGQPTELYFVDACNGYPNIDLIGRDHATAAPVYVPLTKIAEIVFP
ncbi:MAG: carboxypeptidase-like regulatory domain-containing protein [Acidobacteriota bacterium]|nr:carboxypeptidase-like regulatory domain-containing protein [Acidobacteriota bacterium]